MDVKLPLESGVGHWTWFGGRPALDLVNTRRERWRRNIETLVAPGDLGAWLIEAGLAPPGTETDEEELVAGRRLRDAIDAAVDALLAGRSVPRTAVGEIDRWLRVARPSPRLVLRSGGPALMEPPPEDGVAQALALVALDAARMLGTPERERVRMCASETCGVRFYDHSPGGRRRWCSMERCGNVAKARRHRRRARA
jgi:predicted RNA-binding Zn ribbon-like protein